MLSLKAVSPRTEYSTEFLQGMLDRMATSFHKYGAVADAYPHKLDALASMRQRVKMYRESGNQEFLIDAANFLMIEFLCPSQNAFLWATDSDKSPGRVAVDGSTTRAANEAL